MMPAQPGYGLQCGIHSTVRSFFKKVAAMCNYLDHFLEQFLEFLICIYEECNG
jgi:hypothetical protein